MKIETIRRDIKFNDDTTFTEFGVEAGPHIMHMLSSLYTDPLAASVREYMTNMVDAYVADDFEVPVDGIIYPEIFLPGSLDPTLTFKDYGVGMSDDTVMKVFTRYGKSTKSHSNTAAGGYGVGAKAAFCYNNGSHFLIESRYKGTKTFYTAFVNGENIPTLARTGSEPTDEPSGVSVSIPILMHDFDAVFTAVKKYLKHFPIPVVVHNADTYQLTDLKNDVFVADIVGSGYRYAFDGNGKFLTIVMGGVPYEVDGGAAKQHLRSAVIQKMGNSELRDAFPLFTRDNYSYGADPKVIILTVPVGAVKTTPSRDALQFDAMTIEYLSTRMADLMNDLPARLKELFAAQASFYDAISWVRDLPGIIYNYVAASNTELVYTHTGTELIYDAKANAFQADALSSPYIKSIDVGIVEATGTNGSAIKYTESANVATPLTVSLVKNLFIVINDDHVGFPSGKFNRALLDVKCIQRSARTNTKLKYGHQYGHVITITPTDMKHRDAVIAEIQRAFHGWSVDNIHLASDLIEQYNLSTTPILRTVMKKKEISIYRYNPMRDINRERWSGRVRLPQRTGTKYYVPIDISATDGRIGSTLSLKSAPSVPTRSTPFVTMAATVQSVITTLSSGAVYNHDKNIASELSNLNVHYSGFELYGVRAKDIANLPADFVRWDAAVIDVLARFASDPALTNILLSHSAVNANVNVFGNMQFHVNFFTRWKEKFPNDTLINEIVTSYQEYTKHYNMRLNNLYVSLQSIVGLVAAPPIVAPPSLIQDKLNMIAKASPLYAAMSLDQSFNNFQRQSRTMTALVETIRNSLTPDQLST